MKIFFESSKVKIEANLNNSKTALAVYESLPLKAKVNTWGKEIYFPVPVICKPQDPTLDVEAGDVAYWPEGKCLCIFFGKTPASTDDKPRPASEVDVIGRVEMELSVLHNLKSGDAITVRR